MSETLIASLNSRVTELTQQVANLNAALNQERREKKVIKTDLEKAQGAASAELKTLGDQVAALTAERDKWKGQAEAAPGQQAQRVTELEGQLRERDHRDVFRSEAAKAGVKPEATDDLYQLLGLKPGDQPPKPEDFGEPLKAARTARAWAFGASPETNPAEAGGSQQAAAAGSNGSAAQGPVQVPATPAPAGSGRSASDTSPAKVTYRMSDVQQPGWEKAMPQLKAALAESKAVCVGE